ncbi:DUF4124 domain-containing protein [Oxalobacteraceae bacterium R-40]|uniref:DUF4124 domain-containing protein n=1 Tax=Keguizhuia sedimenti TaxID=3064264 RepID=A0ABU1BN44_9BURK|nr:DUF4124 domain-containing protein [Oxalobacteraceae bacterium R-40]
MRFAKENASLRSKFLYPALFLLVSLLLPVSTTAQIYKWVDQNGKTQYGDRPPSERKEPQLLKVNPDRQATTPTSTWEDNDREFRKRRIERQMQAEKEAAPVAAAQQICMNARHALQMLDGKVVFRLNDKGERVYMEDEERNAVEKKAMQDIATYCRR